MTITTVVSLTFLLGMVVGAVCSHIGFHLGRQVTLDNKFLTPSKMEWK